MAFQLAISNVNNFIDHLSFDSLSPSSPPQLCLRSPSLSQKRIRSEDCLPPLTLEECGSRPSLPWSVIDGDSSMQNAFESVCPGAPISFGDNDDESETSEENMEQDAVLQKKRPISSKKAIRLKQQELHTRFSPILPLLTIRPYFKNNELLFGHIVHLINASVYQMLHTSDSDFVRILSESEFMKPSSMTQMCEKVLRPNDRRACEWRAAFANFDSNGKAYNKPHYIAIFYQVYKEIMHVFDFESKQNSCVTQESVRAQLHAVDKNQIINMHYCDFLRVDGGSGIGGKRRNGLCYNVNMSLPCKQKLLCALLLLMVFGSNESPIECTDNLQMLTQADCNALLHFFAQSMLYYCLEEETDIIARITKYLPARESTPAITLIKDICEQRNTKSHITRNKKHLHKIGKFKGRQSDGVFCIVINENIGFHVTYADLFAYSIFELLMRASQCPNESDFNYDDLHKKLPLVFPKKQSKRFGSKFQLNTPFWKAHCPHACFGPIRNLLHPESSTAEELVAANGKTWKIDCTIKAPEEKFFDDQNRLGKFIEALNLCPNNIIKFKWNEWVKVVDNNDMAYGIYYNDCSFSPEEAVHQLQRYPRFEVTKYQKPERVFYDGFNKTRHEHEMLTVRFVKDPFHKIWKGSRSQGIALRRHYKNDVVYIHTFVNSQHFLTKAHGEDHGFLQVVDFQKESMVVVDHPSFVVSTMSQIASIFNTMPQKSLMHVDDIGPCKIFVRGNEPVDHFMHCVNCQIATSDSDWTNILHVAASTRMLPHGTTWEPHVQDYQVEFGQGMCSVHVVNAAATVNVFDQIKKTTQNASYSSFEVLAVRGKNMTYLPTFHDFKTQIINLAAAKMTACGATNLHPSATKPWISEVTMSKMPCTCCRTPAVCTKAIAIVVFVLDILCGGNVFKHVNTTITLLAGKMLQSDSISAPIGLRCKHNWTKGLQKLSYEVIIGTHVSPDLTICSRMQPFVATSSPTSRVLYLL